MITGRFINWTKRKLEKALSDKEVGRHNFPILVIKDTRIRLFKTQSSILMIISLIYEIFIAALHVRNNPAYGSGAGVEQWRMLFSWQMWVTMSPAVASRVLAVQAAAPFPHFGPQPSWWLTSSCKLRSCLNEPESISPRGHFLLINCFCSLSKFLLLEIKNPDN